MLPIELSWVHESQVQVTPGKDIFKTPRKGNPYTDNITKHENFDRIIHNSKDLIKTLSFRGIDKFNCYYCGSPDARLMTGFVHDRSNINSWAIFSLHCASLLCKTCHSHFGKSHISFNRRTRNINVGNPHRLLSFEPEVLIPTLEPVDLHFNYSLQGLLIPLSSRAENTINAFSLNRDELSKTRLNLIYDTQEEDFEYKSNHSDLFEFIHRRKWLSDTKNIINIRFVIQAYFEKFNAKHGAQSNLSEINLMDNLLGFFNETYSKSIKKTVNYSKLNLSNSKSIIKLEQILFKNKSKEYSNELNFSSGLDHIKLSGLRGFEKKQQVNFNGRNSLLLIGENGVGKSTFLSAIQKSLQKNFNLSNLLECDAKESNFEVALSDGNIISQKNLLRKKPRPSVVYINEQRLSNRDLDNLISLLITSSKNDTLKKEWYINKLQSLLSISNISITDNDVSYYHEGFDSNLSISTLSSGYRSVLNIFYQIVKKAISNNLSMDDYSKALYSTIVIIDEIELHLHPKFKKQIVNNIKDAFPEVLFVMSTHDPLVLISAKENCDLVVFEKNNYKTYVRQELPDHTQLTTEQILSSPIFGLDTISDDQKFETMVSNYHEAIRNKDLTTINKSRTELSKAGYFGSSFRELIALSAVDTYLARGESPDQNDIETILFKADNN